MPQHKRHNEVVVALDTMRKQNERISVSAVAKKLGLTSTAIRPDRHDETIAIIEKAKQAQTESGNESRIKKETRMKLHYREQKDIYEARYEEALNKIVSLEYQVWELSRELAEVRGELKNKVTLHPNKK